MMSILIQTCNLNILESRRLLCDLTQLGFLSLVVVAYSYSYVDFRQNLRFVRFFAVWG